ncbi:phage GP46 family protein [Labrys wisconsinensis]|uniref:Phage gp46-like protein n=1 Tax=Labrys wisconsinensis TaxID=425677 RepID=A0ABU0JEW9_9HYPH|nr:phage GP46 family protein [Labrys wisconsinensis]MDQ0472823.1 phage gp46-like protein [Labrys wisconsinensis]
MATYAIVDDGLTGPWDTVLGDVASDWEAADPGLEPGNGGGLAARRSLETAVILCLMSDRYATVEDGRADEDDPRGWAGDGFDVRADLGEAELGSHLWLLRRQALTAETARRAEDMAHVALRPLIAQGAFARIDAVATPDPEQAQLLLAIAGYGDAGDQLYDRKFALLWAKEGPR